MAINYEDNDDEMNSFLSDDDGFEFTSQDSGTGSNGGDSAFSAEEEALMSFSDSDDTDGDTNALEITELDENGNPVGGDPEGIMSEDEYIPSETEGDAMSSAVEQDDEVIPFSEKVDPKELMDNQELNGEMPPVLNKKLILIILTVIFFIFFAFVIFVMPVLTKKKTEKKTARPIASEERFVDYSLSAKQTEGSSKISVPADDRVKNEATDSSNGNKEYDEDGIPKVNSKYSYKEDDPKPKQPQVVSGGSGSGYVVPDTREDSLTAKRISGIKGISSTQSTYMSDSVYQPPTTNDKRVNTTSGSSNPYAQYGLPADREKFTSSLYSQYIDGMNGNSYAKQNDQSGKNNFYRNNRENAGQGEWLPINTIWQGTIFEATLTSAIITDLPGECTAVITKNIYSSQDGKYLLIPQNSKLLGSYNSSISYSQSRVQVGWHTLIRPDGYQINLGNMNTTDTTGASGLWGLINDHPFAYLKALGLMTAFNIANGEIKAAGASTDNQYIQQLASDSYELSNKLGDKLIDRAMDVQPTIKIKAGKRINIVASANLILPPVETPDVTQKYVRYK